MDVHASIHALFASDTTHPPLVLLYASAMVGSLFMYLFASGSDQDSRLAIRKIRGLIPGRNPVFYQRLDFVIFIFLGPVVGMICFDPQGSFQALAAGFSWVGAVGLLSEKGKGLGRDHE